MKTLNRPNVDFFNMFENLNPMFEFFRPTLPTFFEREWMNIPMDVYEKDDFLYIRAFLPGVPVENLDVMIDNYVLTIKGEAMVNVKPEEKVNFYVRELFYGKFERVLRLPETVNVEKVETEFANGILTVWMPLHTLPKVEPKKLMIRNVATPTK